MHKATKATSISPAVKTAVWERDGGRCVCCGSRDAAPNAHFIPRSRMGLGCEENIVTLCQKCHRIFDQPGTDGEVKISIAMRKFLRSYLEVCYPDWDEKKVIYKKGVHNA